MKTYHVQIARFFAILIICLNLPIYAEDESFKNPTVPNEAESKRMLDFVKKYHALLSQECFTYQILNINKCSPDEIKRFEYDRILLANFFRYWYLVQNKLIVPNVAIDTALKNAFIGGALNKSILPEHIDLSEFNHKFPGATLRIVNDEEAEKMYKDFRLYVEKTIKNGDLPRVPILSKRH